MVDSVAQSPASSKADDMTTTTAEVALHQLSLLELASDLDDAAVRRNLHNMLPPCRRDTQNLILGLIHSFFLLARQDFNLIVMCMSVPFCDQRARRTSPEHTIYRDGVPVRASGPTEGRGAGRPR